MAPPPTPTGLTVVSGTYNTISLSWSASAGADFYSIYVDDVLADTFEKTNGDVSVESYGLQTHEFKVSATGGSGESDLSDPVIGITSPLLNTVEAVSGTALTIRAITISE